MSASSSNVVFAEGFGDGNGRWRLPKSLGNYGVSFQDIDGGRGVRVGLPPATEIGDGIVPCGSVPGEFADVDVAVVMTFEQAAEGVGAGYWLRHDGDRAISVMLWASGAVTVSMRYDMAGNESETLASIGLPAPLVASAPTAFRARIVGDLVTVYVSGLAVGSVRCPTGFSGTTELRTAVADRERVSVLLADAIARLP